MKCEYCGTEDQTGKKCSQCGGKLPELVDSSKVWKSGPFLYNGYICYCMTDMFDNNREVQFWLGHDLIERIVVARELLDIHVKPYEDPMSFFWELFKVARGEQEVMKIKEKNERYPTTFEVRRIENPDKERWQSLSSQDLASESVRR